MSAMSSGIVRTMCPMNCHPTLCGMLAEVRDGKLVAVTGDEANPDSQGFLCVRGHAAREVIDNPARLLHPLIRDARTDDFRRATWDEALDRIVASISRSPPGRPASGPDMASSRPTTARASVRSSLRASRTSKAASSGARR